MSQRSTERRCARPEMSATGTQTSPVCMIQYDHGCCYCRIEYGRAGTFISGCVDDGEIHAGSRMLHLLDVCKTTLFFAI